MTEAARTAVNAWSERMAALRADQRRAGASATVSEELSRRAALDQAARDGVSSISDGPLSQEEKDAAIAEIWPRVMQIDADNSAYLKRALPPAGWFSSKAAGADAAHDAWLILQHSPDRILQKSALRRMTPMLATGEVSGPDYARLFDRVAIFDGKPQRFGTQATCKDGRKALESIEDEPRVAERRREVGLTESLADYAIRLGVGKSC